MFAMNLVSGYSAVELLVAALLVIGFLFVVVIPVLKKLGIVGWLLVIAAIIGAAFYLVGGSVAAW